MNITTPISVESLKEACVHKFEELILSGELHIGERLPSERRLAEKFGVSRPIIHEALVDLSMKGIVTIRPRKGVYINDYANTGSLAMLSTLLSYNEGNIDPQLANSLIEMRMLIETEIARLAAIRLNPIGIQMLEQILIDEVHVGKDNGSVLVELDFKFHLSLAIASGNAIYPMILNSFKSIYTNLTRQFFTHNQGSDVIDEVLSYHKQLVQAIKKSDPALSAYLMAAMLSHGETHLWKGRKNGNSDM